jgi:hypothetical protein
MFTIYILKKIETILQPGRGIGTIVDVSQRAVEPNFPTGTIYRIAGLLAMGIAGSGGTRPLMDSGDPRLSPYTFMTTFPAYPPSPHLRRPALRLAARKHARLRRLGPGWLSEPLARLAWVDKTW